MYSIFWCAPSSGRSQVLSIASFDQHVINEIESNANNLLSSNKTIDNFIVEKTSNEHFMCQPNISVRFTPFLSCHKHALSNHRMTFSMWYSLNMVWFVFFSMLFDPWAFVLSTLFTINLDCITMFNFNRNSLVRTIGSSFFSLSLAQCLAFYQCYSNQFMAYNPCTSYLVIVFKSPYNKINKSENRSEVRTQSFTNTM